METEVHVKPKTQTGDSVLEYMAEKHETLANDYKTADGKNSEYCVSIAEQIFMLLTVQGKVPYIVKVHNTLDGKDITPKAFNGRVKWGEHHVCCEGKLVYDPMVSATPVSLEDYDKAFEEKVEGEIWAMSLGDFF